MLGEFKSDQLFVEKTKLYVENEQFVCRKSESPLMK